MKLISFELEGRVTYGVVQGNAVLDLGRVFGERARTLKAMLKANLIGEAAELAKASRGDLLLAQVKLLPVIPDPGQIVCIGLNYADHVQETGRQVTESPTLFLRVASSQVAHGVPMVLPPESQKFDFEGEIAVVIGTGGRRIAEADAWNHIAGYSCYNDGSIRDWQAATTQWTAGKNFWRTGAFGPWLVTADEIAPGQVMSLTTRLNGIEVQQSSTDKLIHSIPRQIAYISTFMPLEPGDVIVTGTPGGVGFKRTPPLFMKAGDIVEVEVDAIGVLKNHVVAESEVAA
jgi:2-keto-4-pentenoate hydratase/2-oxohepta-3-ene-1,7-dioic acid hydratase in catechol pathway